MNKIRYLLSFSNIKPNAADKEKMASALLDGGKKRKKHAALRKATPAVRVFLIVICIVCFTVCAGYVIYRTVTNTPVKIPETTVTEAPDIPAPDGEYVRIDPLYESRGSDRAEYGIYDLLRTVISDTDVYTVAGNFVSKAVYVFGDRIFSEFNAANDDKKDVITSLYAFAEPDKIQFTESGPGPGEKRVLILGTEKERTFEYFLSTAVNVIENDVYIFDTEAWLGDLSYSSVVILNDFVPVSAIDPLKYYKKVGTVQKDSPDGPEYYMINTDLLQDAVMTKVRIENGLPVIYDRASLYFYSLFDGVMQNTLYISKEDRFCKDGSHYYVMTGISLADKSRSFTPTEKAPDMIGSVSYVNSKMPRQYFMPAPAYEKNEVCGIINELGCDWFLYLCRFSGVYLGIPIYCDGNTPKDINGKSVKMFFDPYNSAVPLIDLEETVPQMVSVNRDGYTVNTVTRITVDAPDDSSFEEYKKAAVRYPENVRRFGSNGLAFLESGFSVETFDDGDPHPDDDAVKETAKELLERLGVGYKARFDLTMKNMKNKYILPVDSVSAVSAFYERYAYFTELKETGSSIVSSSVREFVITETDESPLYMKTENGREYRIDRLKGFTYFKNGVITDLDNRVFAINAGGSIGMINTSHTEPVAALYVLSDKDGLLYIGTDMPDNYEKYLPCEYITFGDNGAQTVKFCFGYLQDYIGPYLIPTDITVNDNSPFSVINISAEDPEYAAFSFCRYDEQTGRCVSITRGRYGDSFVSGIGRSWYRTEQAAGVKRTNTVQISLIAGNTDPVIQYTK